MRRARGLAWIQTPGGVPAERPQDTAPAQTAAAQIERYDLVMPAAPPRPARRIASLLPAATEIAAALGLGDRLVGVSHECDHPPEVRALPRLTRSRLAPPPRRAASASRAIDENVREVARDVLGVYAVELEALRAAAPDLILTQDLCDVCAVPRPEVERAVAAVLGPRVAIANLAPLSLGDVWRDVRRVAEAAGVPERGEALVAELRSRADAVAARARRAPRRPPIVTLEWLDPVMLGGTWMPELALLAGAEALAVRAGDRAPTLSRAELSALAPEVVLIKPCGFTLAETRAESPLIRELLKETRWPAAATGRVFLADGNAYFNRPGPRLVESLEILAACVHPDLFPDFRATHAPAFEAFA
jgi:iron complex transport system substrate-binding protein